MSVVKQASRMNMFNALPDKDRAPDDVAKFLAKLPTRCLIHEEAVNSFCMDHDQLICNVCGLSSHSQCGDTIMGFKDASKGFRSSREVTQVSGNMKKLKDKYEKCYKEQSELIEEIVEREKLFVKALRTFREEINAILERLENALLAKKDDFVIHKKRVFKDHKERCRTATIMLETYMKDIDRSFLNGEDETVFIAVKKSRAVLDSYTKQLKEIQQSPKKVNMEFEPNRQVEKFFLNLKDIGTMKTGGDPVPEVNIQFPVITKNMDRRMSVVSLTTDRSLEPTLGAKSDKRRGSMPMLNTSGVGKVQPSKIKTRRPIAYGEESVILDTDENDPFLTGVTFMPDDHVVCIDDANKTVKLFSAALKPVTSLKMQQVPRDVAPVKMQLVVVTQPSDKSLQFIELGRELTLGNRLELDIECSGITCYQHELYVTSGFSVDRQIQIVSLKGVVRKRIRPGIADLRYPLFLTVDPKLRTIFVTDYNHGVVGIDLNSTEVQFKCKDTDVHGYYKGITMGHKGQIYTCTWNLNGVSRVHLDGRGLETIIPMPDKEGRKPHSIAYSNRSSRMLVSMCGGKRGCLAVYKFQ